MSEELIKTIPPILNNTHRNFDKVNRSLLFEGNNAAKSNVKIEVMFLTPTLHNDETNYQKDHNKWNTEKENISKVEPSLQKKKRVIFNRAETTEEYMLLGSQKKFASSIPYRSRRAFSEPRLSLSQAETIKPVTNENIPEHDDESIKKKLRDAPFVQIDKNEKQAQKYDEKKMTKEIDEISRHNFSNNHKQHNLPENTGEKSFYDNEYKSFDNVLKPMKIKSKNILKNVKQNHKLIDKENVPIHNSENHVRSDFSLKYKAGIVSKRPKFKRMSEYQRQFQWKSTMESSPILTAEKSFIKNEHKQKLDCKPSFNEFNKIERSKSELEITQSSSPIISKDSKYLTSESKSPIALCFPQNSLSHTMESEYFRNFKSPQIYDYDNGNWKISTPHEPEEGSNWFDEVKELRQKAYSYKHRAYGPVEPTSLDEDDSKSSQMNNSKIFSKSECSNREKKLKPERGIPGSKAKMPMKNSNAVELNQNKAVGADLQSFNENKTIPEAWKDNWSELSGQLNRSVGISAQSMASSCSFASSILEKSKNRKNFWK